MSLQSMLILSTDLIPPLVSVCLSFKVELSLYVNIVNNFDIFFTIGLWI